LKNSRIEPLHARSSKLRGRADEQWPKWQTYSPAEAADAGTPPESNCLSFSLQRAPSGSVPAAELPRFCDSQNQARFRLDNCDLLAFRLACPRSALCSAASHATASAGEPSCGRRSCWCRDLCSTARTIQNSGCAQVGLADILRLTRGVRYNCGMVSGARFIQPPQISQESIFGETG
jgi:hypothetical protein